MNVGRVDVLVAYDVDTLSEEGQRRLRKVAQICKNYGQRVQLSLFECRLSLAQLEDLEAKLLKVMDLEKDSLRIYVLHGGRAKSLRAHGRDKYIDFDEPLVL
ncbi:CRISPR-associated endonuclease Cas2 [Thermus sp. 93170]|uniref:CRISPR-associated endonuclease Cas2 n=1 Tax=Thermus sp. 93170 TaxID=1046939 RepID=UPI003F426E06